MKTYVTVLSTNDFLDGVLGLSYTLKKVNSQYSLVVVVNEFITEETRKILGNHNLEYIEFKKLNFNQSSLERLIEINWAKELINTADKLRILSLIQYEKIVFLDADMLILKNIDYLFDKPHGSAVADSPGTRFAQYNTLLNSGLLVIEPNLTEYNKAMSILQETNGLDQDIFRELWPEWKFMPERKLSQTLNVFVCDIPIYLKNHILFINDIEVLHFITMPKPFQKEQFNIILTVDFLYYYAKEIYEIAKKENG